ncbi:hypothetical protein JCM10207_002449 [Rhodosporidiobolus poonsookiae]
MGKLVWHSWARLLALTSGAYVAWAALWAFFYRKFFWDFVGGTLGPTGLIPPASAAFFIKVIVDAPILQVLNLLNGLFTLALEWPLNPLVGTAVHESHVFRLIFYFWSAFLAMFVYQTVDGGVFYFIAMLAYSRSLSKGEQIGRPWVHNTDFKLQT